MVALAHSDPPGFAALSITSRSASRGCHVVWLCGELDLANAPQLDRFLAHIDGHVRIDCSELTFLDASGLRVLIAASARLASLRMVSVPATIRRILQITDTTSLLAPD